MLLGVPKETKTEEYRVGLTPHSVQEVCEHGHQVLVESDAGSAIGFSDQAYISVGAEVVPTAADVYSRADMIVKVKEPQADEYSLLRENQILFTYLHLAPDLRQTQALIDSGCVAVAYETVLDSRGGLPLLTPMSQVAGRLSIQVGARCLEKPEGGSGVLLGGVPGVCPGKVVVIGGGVVGTNAVRMAMGNEAIVTVLDKSLHRLKELDFEFGGRLNTLYSSKANLTEYVSDADLVVGAVLIPGLSAPKLLGREILQSMRPGSVLVDVAIDQGGCFDTSRPTTHASPTYLVDEVVHYCVANMPGAVPRTSTLALNNATLPYVLDIANKGFKQAMRDDCCFLQGLNVCHGNVTHAGVAAALGLEHTAAEGFIH